MTLSNNDSRVFESIFFEELEKLFTADIACCELCYDDFRSQWPAFPLRELAFRAAQIDLNLVYSGSRLCELYTENEYNDLVKEINCPRCRRPLASNIWAYTFPFNPPKDFDKYASEMAAIARETPFLVLQHPFARKVYR